MYQARSGKNEGLVVVGRLSFMPSLESGKSNLMGSMGHKAAKVAEIFLASIKSGTSLTLRPSKLTGGKTEWITLHSGHS